MKSPRGKLYQPNKSSILSGKQHGDCVVRAITKVTGLGWYEVFPPVAQMYCRVCVYGVGILALFLLLSGKMKKKNRWISIKEK